MNNRITLQDITKAIARKTGKKHREVELFLKNLLTILMEDIETEGSIEIKGLGIFKLVRIEERESIHVNTGERFLIPVHYRYSFLPDKQLKESVNKPFSFFESVELDEKVSLTDLEEDASPEEGEEETEEEGNGTVPEPSGAMASVSETPAEPEPEIEEVEKIADTEPIAIPFVKETETPAAANQETKEEAEEEFEDTGNTGNTGNTGLKQVIRFVAFVILVGFLFLGYRYLKEHGPEVLQENSQTAALPAPAVAPDTTEIKSDTVERKEAVDSSKTSTDKSAENQFAQTEPEVIAKKKIKEGDRLTSIAREYYGNKVFWVYIYRYNQTKISNPDRIPIGTELLIPAPSVFGIDSQDQGSLAKARALQTEILRK